MKIALIHDYLKEFGGAERVLEALHELWPKAPIFTTVFLPHFAGPHQKRLKNWPVKTSLFQKIPFKEKLISPFRLLAPLVFEAFDFRDFDLVLVSATGAYFPNLIVTRPETLHLSYYHTPPRYLYGYPTARLWQSSWLTRVFGQITNHFLRQIDFVAAQRPDYLLSNSQTTAARIKKFYRRDATVIYPPVELVDKTFKLRPKPLKDRRYFLAGGRLAAAKNIELAVKAANQLKIPLKVFGKTFAGYGQKLQKIAGPTVEFLGEVSDQELIKLYADAKALIYPSLQEDFGLVPVEAMALGTPVIALRQGGVTETVIEGKTGLFFNQPTVESLISVVKKFREIESQFKPDLIKKQARQFNKERFKKEIKKFVEKKLKEV